MIRLNWCVPALALCLVLPALSGPARAQIGDIKKGIGDVNVRAGGAEFHDITIGSPDTGSVSIGKISFIGFVQDGEKVKADKVEIEKLVGKVGNRTIEVPAVTVTGFEAPTDLYRALSEGGNADRDWIALFQKAVAAQITVEKVLDHNPTLSFESVINAVAITNVKDGKIGSARFAGMTGQSNAAAQGGPASIKIGALDYQGINVTETMRLFSGGGTGEAKRLLERAVMAGLEMTTPEGSFKFERIEMAGFDGRAPSEVLQPADRAAMQSGEAFEDPARRQKLARYFGELIRYMKIERYSLEGFTVTLPQGLFTIKGFTFGGWSGRGLDLFEIKGMDVPTPTGPVKLGRFALEKLTYGPFVDAVLEAVASGKEPDFDPAKIVAIAPRLAAIRFAAIDVNTPEGPVSLGGFDIELDPTPGKLPERIATALKGLKVQISAASSDEGRKQLLALGYSEFLADAQVQLRWLPNEKAVVLENTNLVMDKIGRMDISARMSNVDVTRLVADPTGFVPDDAKIESVELRLKNLGVADRFYALTAKSAGISPDAVRDGLAAEIKARAAAILGPALSAGSADALAKFLKTPGTLVVRATPKAGKTLTLGEVNQMDPPAILERLQITVDAGAN
jgi:hypothetical protein